jgi:hypothetical protein
VSKALPQVDEANVLLVMPGLVPGIHVLLPRFRKQVVDGRDKPGHDDGESVARIERTEMRERFGS